MSPSNQKKSEPQEPNNIEDLILEVNGREWIGILFEVPAHRTLNSAWSIQTGLRVQKVVAQSPAQKSGIRAGDLIIEVDKTPVCKPIEFLNLLGQHSVGDILELRLKRGDEVLTLSLEIGENPQSRCENN